MNKRPAPSRLDGKKLYSDVRKAVKELGVTLGEFYSDTGTSQYTMARLRDGCGVTAGTMLAVCEWSGLNPMDYVLPGHS